MVAGWFDFVTESASFEEWRVSTTFSFTTWWSEWNSPHVLSFLNWLFPNKNYNVLVNLRDTQIVSLNWILCEFPSLQFVVVCFMVMYQIAVLYFMVMYAVVWFTEGYHLFLFTWYFYVFRSVGISNYQFLFGAYFCKSKKQVSFGNLPKS